LAVLRDFYASTGGDNWSATVANVNKWFADDTDPCSWFGVGCDAMHEHVTGLDLSGGNLSGSLPANLATLKQLRYLVVDNNRLSGPIPSPLATAIFILNYLRSTCRKNRPVNEPFSTKESYIKLWQQLCFTFSINRIVWSA